MATLKRKDRSPYWHGIYKLANAGNIIRDRYVRQAVAPCEGITLNGDDTIRDRDTRQATAITEGPKFDASNRLTFDIFWNHQIS